MSWFEGKKKWIAGALAGIGGIIAAEQGFRRTPEGSEPRDAGAEMVRDEQDAAERQRERDRQLAAARAYDADQTKIAKVWQAIDAMTDDPKPEEDEPEGIERIRAEEALEQLGKASRLKEFFEKSVPGLKAKMSSDGDSLKLGFPDSEGNVDAERVVFLNLSATGMVRVGSVTNFDAPIDLPVDSDDNLGAVREAVAKKFLILDKDRELTQGKMFYDEATERGLKDFIQQQGLRVQ